MRFVILHYHLFKNAGSTIEDILDRSFGERFGRLETSFEGGILTNPELLRHLDCHSGLRAFSSHQIRYPKPQAPGYLFFDICFLRDPIDRLRSFYDYFRQRPNPADPMSELANRSEPGVFVERMVRDYPLFVKNNQVNLLACGGDSDEPDEGDLRLAIQRALGASFLGVVDEFERSIAAGSDSLRCAFPELDCDVPAVNVSRGLQGTVASRTAELRAACRPEVFEELLRVTELDRQLVAAARAEVLRRFETAEKRGANGDSAGVPRLLSLVGRSRELSVLFDADFYLNHYPDVRAAGMNPLIHYLRHGAAEDRKPNPLFDPAYYRLSSGRNENGRDLFLRFLNSGPRAASPHPLFDCAAYARANPDVEDLDQNPLVHYLDSVRKSGHGAVIEIGDVRCDWQAPEPQQVPFLQSVDGDQLRAQIPLSD